MERYQNELLGKVLEQAAEKVPYYRGLFAEHGVDIGAGLDGLSDIPKLTKEALRENYAGLTAEDAQCWGPKKYTTTGTSGEPVSFLLDKNANILEFCYYWRYWGWAGYGMRSPFAELSLQHFIDRESGDLARYERFTNRLVLNPAQVGRDSVAAHIRAMKSHGTRFLKGSPSTLAAIARIAGVEGLALPKMKAVFTTGEMVIPRHRKLIEEAFGCPLMDSYGHMERTIAVCQCPDGRYHINPEYGILELEEVPELSKGDVNVGKVTGTGLHNMAMPLIRYELGDLMQYRDDPEPCPCGRKLPVIEGIIGRSQHVLATPDGRFITNAFILFSEARDVKWLQLVQDRLDRIALRVVKGRDFVDGGLDAMLAKLSALLGSGIRVEVEYIDISPMSRGSGTSICP